MLAFTRVSMPLRLPWNPLALWFSSPENLLSGFFDWGIYAFLRSPDAFGSTGVKGCSLIEFCRFITIAAACPGYGAPRLSREPVLSPALC